MAVWWLDCVMFVSQDIGNVIEDRGTLRHCLEELDDDLWDALKKERHFLGSQVVLLKHTLSVREEAAGEPVVQGSMGVWEEGVMSSVVETDQSSRSLGRVSGLE